MIISPKRSFSTEALYVSSSSENIELCNYGSKARNINTIKLSNQIERSYRNSGRKMHLENYRMLLHQDWSDFVHSSSYTFVSSDFANNQYYSISSILASQELFHAYEE